MSKRTSRLSQRHIQLEQLEHRQLLSVNVGELDSSEQPALIGDVNADGRFDSVDLIEVLQKGEYEDGVPYNSDFAEGDWNGDREFTSYDLIFAMQSGKYNDAPAAASKAVIKRDLQEFLDAQGTLLPPDPAAPQTPAGAFFWNNPDINGDGVNEGTPYIFYVDLFGTLSRNSAYGGVFGPESVTGKVTERPLGNGMSEVTASVATKGALIWVTERDGSTYSGPTVFGYRETELLADPSLEAARADVQFTANILQPEGAPLEDIIASFIGNRFQSWQFVLNATGPLPTGEADFGVPDGTTGRMTWGKPGFWLNQPPKANPNASNGAYSLFPNDQFHLAPIGRG